MPITLNRIFFAENNHNDYSHYSTTVMRRPLKQDTFTFSGKLFEPKIYCANGKNAVTELAYHGVGCFCCGRNVIPRGDFNAMEAEGYFKCSTDEILKRIRPYKSLMSNLEKRVFVMLEKLHKAYPQDGLAALLQRKQKDVEQKLIDKQSKVFGKIYDYAVKHINDDNKLKELDDIFTLAYDEIYGRVKFQTFSRKRFIGSIYKFVQGLPEKQQKKLVDIAQKLPTSQDEFGAFVIKYSRKSNKEIAKRLLEKRVGCIEHLHAKADGGPDDVGNYVQECGECNWGRGDGPMDKFIKQKHPDMPANAQKYMNKTIALVNSHQTEITAANIIDQRRNAYIQSKGLIDLDISSLNPELVPDEYMQEFINICKKIK